MGGSWMTTIKQRGTGDELEAIRTNSKWIPGCQGPDDYRRVKIESIGYTPD
jgi:hypothetical protein